MWQFLREYLSAPNTVGALAPSSRHLAASMTASIDFGQAHCIVEYGAGTGVFTTFQYTLLRKTFLEQYFNIQRLARVWRNLPPAYVFHMRAKRCRGKQAFTDSKV